MRSIINIYETDERWIWGEEMVDVCEGGAELMWTEEEEREEMLHIPSKHPIITSFPPFTSTTPWQGPILTFTIPSPLILVKAE